MRFASLGSGSEGNALLVESVSGMTTTGVLLDCGFSAKEVERHLARLDVRVDQIDTILLTTHEHTDHIGGALTLVRKWSIPLRMSWGQCRYGAPRAICVNDLCFTLLSRAGFFRTPLTSPSLGALQAVRFALARDRSGPVHQPVGQRHRARPRSETHLTIP